MVGVSTLMRSRLAGPSGDRMIQYQGTWISRGGVRGLVERLQGESDKLGLPPGAPIGFAAQSRPEFIAALIALLECRQTIDMIYAYQSGEAMARKLDELNLPAVIAAADQWAGPMEAAARARGTAAIAIKSDEPAVLTLVPRDTARSHRQPPFG